MWLLGAGALALAVFAIACHGLGDPRHVSTMHTVAEFENYCWDAQSGMSEADFETLLSDTLWRTEDERDWDGLGGNKVFFFPQGTVAECQQEFPDEAYIQYIVKNGGCGGFSCVEHFPTSPDCYPSSRPGVNHCHYPHQHVTLRAESLVNEDTARHVVNHETGHVLGLNDACNPIQPRDPDCPQIGWQYCRVEIPVLGLTVWIDSIMHAPPSYCFSYGVFRDWPTPLDEEGAGNIIDQEDVPTP